MGLLKKLVKAYQDDRKETQKFLAQVKAAEAKKAAAAAKAAAEAAAPKTYSPILGHLDIPSRIGDMTQAYRYGVVLASADSETIVAAFESKLFNFTIEQSDGISFAVISGKRVGIIPERYEMIADWLRRGDPYRLYLNSYTVGKECKLILVFYKDKAAPHRHREQSVVPLAAYKGKARQEISAYLQSKEEVEIGTEHFGNDDDDAVVTYRGEAIGKVPAKIRSRIEDDGYSYAEIEEVIEEENSNGDEVYHPIIRIYW